MRFFRLSILLSLVFLSTSVTAAADKIIKDTLVSEGKKRTFYLYVPETVKANVRAPLLVVLHGSRGNGSALVERWKETAKREGIIIVGPNSLDSMQWRVPEDGPDFLYELIEALKSKYAVNERRVYLFGHSAGAGQALYMSLLESEYFAATVIHAGVLHERAYPLIERAKRKTPIAIYVGTHDHLLPLPVARATRDALNRHGFAAQYTEIRFHTHWYEDRAAEINRGAWAFLQQHELTSAPRYERYRFGA